MEVTDANHLFGAQTAAMPPQPETATAAEGSSVDKSIAGAAPAIATNSQSAPNTRPEPPSSKETSYRRQFPLSSDMIIQRNKGSVSSEEPLPFQVASIYTSSTTPHVAWSAATDSSIANRLNSKRKRDTGDHEPPVCIYTSNAQSPYCSSTIPPPVPPSTASHQSHTSSSPTIVNGRPIVGFHPQPPSLQSLSSITDPILAKNILTIRANSGLDANGRPLGDLRSTLSLQPSPFSTQRLQQTHKQQQQQRLQQEQYRTSAATTANTLRGSERVGWPDRTLGQKRAYFASQSPDELVRLLMRCVELHPDLPLFPLPEDTTTTHTRAIPSRPLQAGARGHSNNNRAPSLSQGRILHYSPHQRQFIAHTLKSAVARQKTVGIVEQAQVARVTASQSVQTPVKPAHNGRTELTPGTPIDSEEEDDPTELMKGWPSAGEGVYAKLKPDWQDDAMVDQKDFDAFSHIMYDHGGKKAQENGIAMGFS